MPVRGPDCSHSCQATVCVVGPNIRGGEALPSYLTVGSNVGLTRAARLSNACQSYYQCAYHERVHRFGSTSRRRLHHRVPASWTGQPAVLITRWATSET